jgi:hypothetical protein
MGRLGIRENSIMDDDRVQLNFVDHFDVWLIYRPSTLINESPKFPLSFKGLPT